MVYSSKLFLIIEKTPKQIRFYEYANCELCFLATFNHFYIEPRLFKAIKLIFVTSLASQLRTKYKQILHAMNVLLYIMEFFFQSGDPD